MKPVRIKLYKDRWGTEGEIRCGISSWDDGGNESSSVKWAYPDRNGRVSIRSPEVPIDVLFEMVDFVCTNKDVLSIEDRKIVEKYLTGNRP